MGVIGAFIPSLVRPVSVTGTANVEVFSVAADLLAGARFFAALTGAYAAFFTATFLRAGADGLAERITSGDSLRESVTDRSETVHGWSGSPTVELPKTLQI